MTLESGVNYFFGGDGKYKVRFIDSWKQENLKTEGYVSRW